LRLKTEGENACFAKDRRFLKKPSLGQDGGIEFLIQTYLVPADELKLIGDGFLFFRQQITGNGDFVFRFTPVSGEYPQFVVARIQAELGVYGYFFPGYEDFLTVESVRPVDRVDEVC